MEIRFSSFDDGGW